MRELTAFLFAYEFVVLRRIVVEFQILMILYAIRIWDNSSSTKSMIATMKEHKGCVTMTDIKKNDREAVSCSTDGSCILWDIKLVDGAFGFDARLRWSVN